MESVGSVKNILDPEWRLYQESSEGTGKVEHEIFKKSWNLTQTFKALFQKEEIKILNSGVLMGSKTIP